VPLQLNVIIPFIIIYRAKKIVADKEPFNCKTKRVDMTNNKPKVTVLMSTYNRPWYLKEAISSLVRQRFKSWELIVMNDGGVDVGHIIKDFNNKQIRYFNDNTNRGKAARMNFGLDKANGEYIAYLDDDDLFYPDHLNVLSKTLDQNPDIGAAYSDLYAVQCVHDRSTKKRYPIHKFIQVSRDFNRDFMFYFNHTLHVSLMHRKDIAIKAGGYDESIRVLIDWDITRKLCFYTDFLYVPKVTGEYYMPVGKSDRISVLGRENKKEYTHNMRKIKADLPPKPWEKVESIGIIFPVNNWNQATVDLIQRLIDNIFYPVRYFIVNNDTNMDAEKCKNLMGRIGELKNISILDPHRHLSITEAYRFGAINASVRYLYLPSQSVDTSVELRIIAALHHLKKTDKNILRWDSSSEEQTPFDVFIKREDFLSIDKISYQTLKECAAVIPKGIPESFASDIFLQEGTHQYQTGNYRFAYAIFKEAENIKEGGANRQHLINMYARICFELEMYEEAENKLRILINNGYRADNMVMLGYILQKKGKIDEAVNYYTEALKEIGLHKDDLKARCFPIATPGYIGAFEAIAGIGECMYKKNNLNEAARMFRLASKLKANSSKPFIGFAKIFLKTNELEQAEESLITAIKMDKDIPEPYILMGEVFERKNNITDAYLNYYRAFALDKANREIVDPIFRTGSALGKWAEIKNVFEDYLGHHPGGIEATHYLSIIYEKLGNPAKARECLEKYRFLKSLKGIPIRKEINHEHKAGNQWCRKTV